MSDQQGPTHLLQKMLVARSKIGYVKKDSYNAGQKFSFASEEAIINEVRSVLNECGIVISESVQRMEIIPVQKDKGTAFLIFLEVAYTFWDADSGESLICVSVGSGYDETDKGSSKAMTAALKYALIQNMLIPRGYDPDKYAASDEVEDATASDEEHERRQLLRDIPAMHARLLQRGDVVPPLDVTTLEAKTLRALRAAYDSLARRVGSV